MQDMTRKMDRQKTTSGSLNVMLKLTTKSSLTPMQPLRLGSVAVMVEALLTSYLKFVGTTTKQ